MRITFQIVDETCPATPTWQRVTCVKQQRLSPCGWLVCSWIGASYPVPPNFTHWAALKLCTALENFYKFMVKPENLCTCASPEVTHSFKQTPILWHYIFSDATKSIVCLQERGRTKILTVWFAVGSRKNTLQALATSQTNGMASYSRPGLPDWPFHGQFRKIWPFSALAIKMHLAILQNLAIFSVCHCKIKFSLNTFFFCIFGRSSCHSLLQ